MEVTTQYPNASALTTSSEESAAHTVHPNASPTQAKVFSESDVSRQFALRPDEQSVKLNPKAIMFPQAGASKAPPDADQTLSREERGAVLGACAKSEFRECRGGDALNDGASSYVEFDQFDHKETRGADGLGTCEGIAREAMRRIDRNTDGQTPDLRSAVSNMTNEMRSSGDVRTDVYQRIQAFQDNPSSLGLTNYRQSGTTNLNPTGTTSQAERIDGLVDSMSGLSRGELAYIRVGIQRADATGPETSGHVLLAQRLPTNASGDGFSSPDRYTVFDPNNGAFTYESLGQMQSALRGYMESAYTEDNNVAAPNRILSFIPSSSRNWDSLPATTAVPAPDRMLPEPAELLRHFEQSYPGASGSGFPHTELRRSPPSTSLADLLDEQPDSGK